MEQATRNTLRMLGIYTMAGFGVSLVVVLLAALFPESLSGKLEFVVVPVLAATVVGLGVYSARRLAGFGRDAILAALVVAVAFVAGSVGAADDLVISGVLMVGFTATVLFASHLVTRIASTGLAFAAAAIVAEELTRVWVDGALTTATLTVCVPFVAWLVREERAARPVAAAGVIVLGLLATLFALVEAPSGYLEWSALVIAPALIAGATWYTLKGPVLRPGRGVAVA